MKVPFCDLKRQYADIKGDIDNAIKDVVDRTAFVRGEYVGNFEKEYSEKYGAKFCISCANGTDAIFISLKSLGVGPGDEVITTACSWIATSEVISLCGAKPVFVDIEPDFYSIDEKKIEEKITENTKAIIPVHLYGQPCNMDAINKLCKKHNLFLIEDCAQAHFSKFENEKVGKFGDFGTFSFYPGKNLGAYGDAGAIITNNEELAIKARMFANHGSLKKHDHEIEGINSRLDGLQGAILSVKLSHIDLWNKKRFENAKLYCEALKDVSEIKLPLIRKNSTHVFHLFVIRALKRDELQSYLKEKGISSGIHYPKPLPFLKAYEYLKLKMEDYPIACKYQKEIISLPMFPELTKHEIEYVCDNIKNFYKGI